MNAEHKQGDTFAHLGQINSYGATTVSDMTGWQLKSQARTASGALVCEFVVAWIDAAQRTFSMRCADTTAWPLGDISIDIQMTSPSGDVFSTKTFGVSVVKDVTR